MFKKILSVMAIISLIFVSTAVLARADWGDYGGDYDYGGYDSYDSNDYGGDYDYGDDDYDDYDYNDDYDDDDTYDGGNYYYGGTTGFGDFGGGSGGGSLGGAIILVVIIIVVVLIVSKLKNKGSSQQAPVMPGGQATRKEELKDMSEYLTIDPAFSADEFKNKLSNLYVQLQNAWQDKDIEPVRPYLQDAYYNQMKRQLEAYKTKGQTNYIERIAVLSVDLRGFKQEAGNDIVIAQLRCRIVDYTLDDKTGALVKGDKQKEKFMLYEWSLARTSGKTTGKDEGLQSAICPHCGAPVDINATAFCEYCGSVLTTDSFDWVITNIKGLAQKTVG